MNNAALPAVLLDAGSCGNAVSGGECTEATSQLHTVPRARSLSPFPAKRSHGSGPDSATSSSADECQAATGCTEPPTRIEGRSWNSPSCPDTGSLSSGKDVASPRASTRAAVAGISQDNGRLPPVDCDSTRERHSSGTPTKRSEKGAKLSLPLTGSAGCSDAPPGSGVNSPSGSDSADGVRPKSKGGGEEPVSSKEKQEESLHLLFRHHVAAVTCADRFAELLPYCHIFRECVGTYRRPATLPTPARHLLVQELQMLRRDPDRLLMRNSFQWTEAAGAVSCLADTEYGAADAPNCDRTDLGASISGLNLNGVRSDGHAPDDGNAILSSAALAASDADTGRCIRGSGGWVPPLPLLDPSVLLCASGTELAAQKSAVLRILRMLRSLAPTWAARDDNFGFHFKAAIAARSLDSLELQSYRVVFQCLSPFDAREWSRDQLMEVLNDLDCIRLAYRRRRNLKASIARVQRFLEHPDVEPAGDMLHSSDGAAGPRHLWEPNSGASVETGDMGNPPRVVVRGGRDISCGQAVPNAPSPTGLGPVPVSSRAQQVGSFVLPMPHQQQLSPTNGGSKTSPRTPGLSGTWSVDREATARVDGDGRLLQKHSSTNQHTWVRGKMSLAGMDVDVGSVLNLWITVLPGSAVTGI